MKSYFKQQSLFKLKLNKSYYLELSSLNFLNLKDVQGNSLALYESDFKKLYAYLNSKNIIDFPKLSASEKLIHLENAKVRVTRYFNNHNLANYELDFKKTIENGLADILNCHGEKLSKDGYQNCIVVYQGKIYIHKKIRCVIGDFSDEILKENSEHKKGIIGVSHSSLSQGHQVSYAGSFVYDKKYGWTVDNTSGHYITRAYQVKELLRVLEKNGIDLSKLTVKLWIPNNPKLIPPILSESDYYIIHENAAEYMKRMQNTQNSLPKSPLIASAR